MIEWQEWIERIHSVEHGMPRLEIMKQAIQEADRVSDAYWGLYFRHEYIQESCFYEDNFKAVIMFPEYLKLFDEHPELEEEMYYDVMWVFKWMLEDMPEWHQIQKSDIDKYYEEYRKRCENYGISLRVYHMKKSKYLLPIDKAAVKREYDAFRTCKRDSNSDCEACEINHDMTMALEFGLEEEAIRIAQPILTKKKSCREIPHVTYGILTHYYLYHGNLEEAAYYGRLCEKYTDNQQEFLLESGYLLELYSVLNPDTGWNIFKNNIQNFTSTKNPLMRIGFSRGAYRLLAQVEKQTEFCTNPLLSLLPLTKTKDGYRTSEIKEYFYQFAKEQSELLDQRNGTDYYMEQLYHQLPEYEYQEKIQEQTNETKHGLTERIPHVMAAITEDMTLNAEMVRKRLAELEDTFTVLSNTIVDAAKEKNEESVAYEVVQFSLQYDTKIYDATFILSSINEQYQQLVMQMEFHDNVSFMTFSFHLMAHLLYTALPDMIQVIDVTTGKEYSPAWLQFKGGYDDAVFVSDLINLSIEGEEESDEIWMSTRGLACFGIRELELHNANRQNFAKFADLLFFAGCQCAAAGMLPDAGEPFASFRINGKLTNLSWKPTTFVLQETGDTIASRVERNAPTATLVIADTGQLPTEYPLLLHDEELDFPNLRHEFIQKIRLSKMTSSIFFKALQTMPYQMAAVRLEFPIPEKVQDEAGYGVEILWAEITNVTEEGIYAALKETSEYLPDLHMEDIIQVTGDKISAWVFHSLDGEMHVTESNAYLLME